MCWVGTAEYEWMEPVATSLLCGGWLHPRLHVGGHSRWWQIGASALVRVLWDAASGWCGSRGVVGRGWGWWIQNRCSRRRRARRSPGGRRAQLESDGVEQRVGALDSYDRCKLSPSPIKHAAESVMIHRTDSP
jgi:hypothetical protein